MYLTGLIHRERLFELAKRWFANHLEADDGRFVTELLSFENLITGPTIRSFLQDIHANARISTASFRRLILKDQLRDTIIATCSSPSPRAAMLFDQYRKCPEEFFPKTPTDILLGCRNDGRILGMIRVKRIRRVAEKCSRRVADSLASTIRNRARMLAEGRARAEGVTVDQMLSSSTAMREDFNAAEQIVSQLFRDREISFEPDQMRIDDVMGCKFIGTDEELARIEQAIENHPGATIVEREIHRGRYNDTNLLVDLELPPAAAIIDRMNHRNWCFAGGRGLDPATLAKDFPSYVESGARTFRVEIILTTMEELIESEFGRSIHEERIIAQRSTVEYRGRIARNASFLIEYLLRLAISPTAKIETLPIVMWGRYLPDTFSSAVWKLYGIRHGVALMDSFVPEPGEMLGVSG